MPDYGIIRLNRIGIPHAKINLKSFSENNF